MVRFNTFFLLKAITVAAICCLPMALDRESGFVWTAFLLPICLAWLAAIHVGRHGEFEFQFKALSDSVVQLTAKGGRQEQWITRARIEGAGACLSVALGFSMQNVVDPQPPLVWMPVVGLFALGGLMQVGSSARRRVLTAERQFESDYLLFGRLWWRRRWQIREGDVLAVCPTCQRKGREMPESPFHGAVFVCRGRRRQKVGFGIYAFDQVLSDLEIAARRVAALVGIPYTGCRQRRM